MSPIKFTQLNVPTEGGTLRIRVAESSGFSPRATPMLIVHGGPGGTDYLSKFLGEQIADHGYKPIGWIQRGSPGSTKSGPFTVERFIQDYEDIRGFLQVEQMAILGHSWGGFLSTCYAAIFPEIIERLILVCPMGVRTGWRDHFDDVLFQRIPDDEKPLYLQLTDQAKQEKDETNRQEILFKRAQIHVYSYYSPSKREGKPGLAHLSMDVHEALHHSAEEWIQQPAWEQGLQRLHCPSTLICGDEDAIPLDVARDYNEIIPNLNLSVINKCGHFPFFESPEEFQKELEAALTS
ncbi:MAG: alpha/beta hydrolase [Sumerlaeia bacterium]